MATKKHSKKGKKMETHKGQVATKNTAAVGKASDLNSWGKREIRSTSIMIPRILKMEFLSEKVTEGNAKFGEFRDSLSDEVVGSIDKPLVIVPIEVEEKWAVYDLIERKGGKVDKEFRETIQVTAENENWKYQEEGIERDRIMDVYCLLASDIEALPKDWKEKGLKPLPKIFGFRRTSLRAGKKLYTQMYVTNESKGLPPPALTIEITGKKTDGEKGTYITLDTKPGRPSTAAEMDVAFHWYKAIKAGSTKADDSELKTKQESNVNPDEVTDY